MSSDAQSRPSHGHRYMTGAEVRAAFVDFFASKGHREVPSSSLVPINDPTVLLTTAGMQQMTPYFLGLEPPPHAAHRLGPEVLPHRRHRRGRRRAPPDLLLDARQLLDRRLLQAGVDGLVLGVPDRGAADPGRAPLSDGPPGRRRGRRDLARRDRRARGADRRRLDDNWWGPVGATGPCGPDSEIYFDRGPEHGCDTADCAPGAMASRYLEVWNHVFMEFFQAPGRLRTPLPTPEVDTGMGLERLTMVMQGGEVGLRHRPLPADHPAGRRAGRRRPTASMTRPIASLRVMADHIRGGDVPDRRRRAARE